ncbi:MAG TPA: hypothetical protein VGN20_19215 [Mucilaginibacter sp.]|jgi:hypothetical protein
MQTYQQRVQQWVTEAFGPKVANDKKERAYRFIEESIELVQSTGLTKEDVLTMVDYVFGRPAGEPYQEIGGVMVTLASLTEVQNLDLTECAEMELERAILKTDKIRAKQRSKPHSIKTTA